MGKTLDEILRDLTMNFMRHPGKERIAEAHRLIEQAVGEIIGENEVNITAGKYATNEDIIRDKLRAEQRTKLAELLGKGK